MGVRGIDELVAVLPPAAAEPARAVAQGLTDLASLRHSALAPEDVRALGEVWERFTAQVASGRLGVLAAIDARDDVIPKARVGDAGAVFAQHVLGQRRGTARRDGAWAGLLRPEVGDLPAVGAAFAAGDVSRAHVEVVVRAHRDLGAGVRENSDGLPGPRRRHRRRHRRRPAAARRERPTPTPTCWQLRAALATLSDAFTTRVRLIRVVDVLLAHYARSFTVTELEAIAARIVRTLNPPDPKGAHERRYLHMSQLPDGTWRARFECGPEQGLRIKRALAAFSAPRPGTAIDADGVEHAIPDTRDLGARQIDAVSDIITIALAKTGITLPTDTHPAAAPPDLPEPPEPGRPVRPAVRHRRGRRRCGAAGGDGAAGDDAAAGDDQGAFWPAPASRGRGRRPGPTADRAAAGRGRDRRAPPTRSAGWRPTPRLTSWWSPASNTSRPPGPSSQTAYPRPRQRVQRLAARPAPNPHPKAAKNLSTTNQPAKNRPANERATNDCHQNSHHQKTNARTNNARTNHQQTNNQEMTSPLKNRPARGRENHRAPVAESTGISMTADESFASRQRLDDLGWLGRALSPYGIPARMEQAGLVDADHPGTARLQRHHPGGAARPQRRHPRPRPHPTPGHPRPEDRPAGPGRRLRHPRLHRPRRRLRRPPRHWWTRGGPTDLDNLALACGRHHTEVHQETWEIQIRDGIPWVTPPSWIDRSRRPLRNAAHHPA